MTATPRRHLAVIVWTALLMLVGVSSPANAAPPSNDDVANPMVVPTFPFTTTLDTSEATLEPDEPAGKCSYLVGATVWFEFTPAVAEIVRADTYGSDFDTVLAVWKTNDADDLTEVTCDDSDHVAGTTASAAYFKAIPGIRYLIQIGGYYYSQAGNLTFNLDVSTRGLISGTVASLSDGQPLTKACVYLWNGAGDNLLEGAWTMTDGSYLLGGLLDGEYTLWFGDCDGRYTHFSEWWNDKPEQDQADHIIVTNSSQVTGIDAQLTKMVRPWVSIYNDGGGTVTSEPAGIDCGPDCWEEYEWDSLVTLTANPDPGMRLMEWRHCDSVQGNQCQVEMSHARDLLVTFYPRDSYPPNPSISGGPDYYTASRSARFNLSADEPAEFLCSLDQGPYDPCVSRVEYEDLAEGTHQFRVKAIDAERNVSPTPAHWEWNVDATGPELSVQRPTGGIYHNNTHVGGSGPTAVIGWVNVEVRITEPQSEVDDFGFELNGVPVDRSQYYFQGYGKEGTLYYAFRPSSPGPYDIRVTALNRVGLSSSTTIQVTGIPAP